MKGGEDEQKMIRKYLVLIICFLFIASSFPAPIQKKALDSQKNFRIETQNGIRTVINSETPLFGELSLELEKEFEIDAEKNDEIELERFRSLILNQNGEIYALCSKPSSFEGIVYVFKKSGELKQPLSLYEKISKKIKPITIISNSETNDFYVYEFSQYNLIAFNKTGNFLGKMKLPNYLESCVHINGTEFMGVFREFRETEYYHYLSRFRFQGEVSHPLMEAPYTIYYQKRDKISHVGYLHCAFRIILAKRGSSSYVAGYSKKYQLDVFNREDQPQLRIICDKPIPQFTKRELLRLRAQLSQDHKPFYYLFITDDKNRIFVVRDDVRDADLTTWKCDVFGKKGAYLYHTEIPARTKVIKNGHLLAFSRNSESWSTRLIQYRVLNWEDIKESY